MTHRTPRWLLVAGVAVGLLFPAIGSAGPTVTDATLVEYFRLQWEATPAATGSAIGGYVENVSNLPFERMRLAVERLDQSGAVVGSSTTYVMGRLGARQRAYFTTRVPAAAAYRVRILAFDWANCRD